MNIKTTDDFLEHYGVKGMRWGVRRDRRANTLVKVGKGKGTRSEKTRAALTTSPVDIVKGRGLKGGAKRRGERQLARNKRVRNGEASAKDYLVYYGGTKYQDLIPTGKDRLNTKAAVGATVAGYMLVSVGAQVARNLAKG